MSVSVTAFCVYFQCKFILLQFFQWHTSGWKGRVLSKLRTKTEFRSAVTFACPAPVIHIIAGKVCNVLDAEREVLTLIEDRDGTIAHKNMYSYVKGGVLDIARQEINERPENELKPHDPFSDLTCAVDRNTYTAPVQRPVYTHTVFSGLFSIGADSCVVQNFPAPQPTPPTFLDIQKPNIFSGLFCISNN